MIKSKRILKGHYSKLIKDKRYSTVPLETISKNYEYNEHSNTSLYFDFRDSQDFNFNLIFLKESPYFKQVLSFFEEWRDNNNWRTTGTERRKSQLICLVANLLLLPRTSNGSKIKKPLSLLVSKDIYLCEVVNYLRDTKQINFLKGYAYTGGNYDTSKIIPTVRFDKIFQPIEDDFEANIHVTFQDSDVIRIKKKGKRANFSRTNQEKTRMLAKKIVKINQVNLNHNIITRIKNREYRCCTKLYVVFSGTIQRGGRIYAQGTSYQNIRKKYRASILMDSIPTIELDYANLHPRMLYAQERIEFDGDLYGIQEIRTKLLYLDSQQLRRLVKIALLILINEKKDKNIPGTIASEIRKKDRKLFYTIIDLEKSLYGKNQHIVYKTIIEEITIKHSGIAHHFHSDAGARLQNKDGKMAVGICYTFAKKNIPILPVHDSFIVPKPYEGLLRDTMDYFYRKFNNNFSCPITRVERGR